MRTFNHPLNNRRALLLARDALLRRPECAREREPDSGDKSCEHDLRNRMILVNHAASPTFQGDSQKALAVGARGIDVVVDQRVGGVTDFESGAAQARGHLGFLLVAARARAETFVEQPNGIESCSCEGHVRADNAAHLDHAIAVIDDRQVEIAGFVASNRFDICGRQHAAFHRGELEMVVKETLDGIDVSGRDGQIVVEAGDDFARGFGNRAILRTALAGAGIVNVNDGADIMWDSRRIVGTVVSEQDLMAGGIELRLEAREQARE